MQIHHHYASELSELCTKVAPLAVSQAKVACINDSLISDLALSNDLGNEEQILSALFTPTGSLQINSVAQKYGGHQFGHWNPELGDGRGLLLGEVTNGQDQLVDLHLKGAGPTPYSRHADGRAVLRSTIREYLASEALHALRIPTSRALALITSKEPVMREQIEQGAMLIRTAPSHIRFGHFEYFYHAKEFAKLDALFEFCFKHHFAHLANAENPYLALLTEICTNTANMIAKWQAYGFNHGVMNTDNMSIHGITFDFGPYAFLDDFIPQYVCNKSDHNGRYAFNQQPSIALWNLNALAYTFSQKLNIDDIKSALNQFEPCFLNRYRHEMQSRLGFQSNENLDKQYKLDKQQAQLKLSNQFTQILSDEFADYHQSFRHLSESFADIMQGNTANFTKGFEQTSAIETWCNNYRSAFDHAEQPTTLMATQKAMLDCNPKYVLRNHLMQQAIGRAQQDDFTLFNDLLLAVTQPFTDHANLTHLDNLPGDKEKGVALSCSS